MLIKYLLNRQQQRVKQLDSQARIQHSLRLRYCNRLRQRGAEFAVSTPGLLLSFSAGCLFQLRHNSVVKQMRSVAGFSWIRLL